MNQAEYRRESIVRFVNLYQREHSGQAPTIRQVAKGIGVRSLSVVQHHLDKLVECGELIKDGDKGSRCYRAEGIWIPRTKIRSFLRTGRYEPE